MPISLELWLTYLGAILLMMSTPGPSQLLILSNSMQHGFRPATMTIAGDLSANVLQMLAAGLGLATLLLAWEDGFIIIKWAGVAFLVFIGIKQILTPRHFRLGKAAASKRKLYMQGFLTSAANPRAIFFFGALFPQFIDPLTPIAPQLAVLGATYLIIDGIFLSTYGYFADWIGKRFSDQMTVWGSRVSGGLLIVAAILLGLRDVDVRAN